MAPDHASGRRRQHLGVTLKQDQTKPLSENPGYVDVPTDSKYRQAPYDRSGQNLKVSAGALSARFCILFHFRHAHNPGIVGISQNASITPQTPSKYHGKDFLGHHHIGVRVLTPTLEI